MPPVAEQDKRDRYRLQVDRAVEDMGNASTPVWTLAQRARAKRIAYRAVFTETRWRNLGNALVPESLTYPNDGLGGDKDSIGLFQQRPSQGWGSVQGSMDPYITTNRFLTSMLALVPTWFDPNLDESSVCQQVQRSQFNGKTIDPNTGQPYPYAANYKAEDAATDALEADPLYFTKGGR